MERTAASAAELIKAARSLANLSQNELAQGAGVAQSVVSTYEAGRREPSLSTLRHLIEATGCTFEVQVVAGPDLKRGLPDTPMGRRMRQRRTALLEVAAGHGASNLAVFGSVARGDDHEGSDVDLLADLPASMGLLALGALVSDLEAMLGRKVDLVPRNALKPRVARTALAEAIAL